MSVKWNFNGKHYVLIQFKDSQKRSPFNNHLLYIPDSTCFIFLIVVSCFPLMISLLSNSLYCILIQNVISFLNIVVSYLMDSGESVSYDFISVSLNILF